MPLGSVFEDEQAEFWVIARQCCDVSGSISMSDVRRDILLGQMRSLNIVGSAPFEYSKSTVTRKRICYAKTITTVAVSDGLPISRMEPTPR
jgi:hypothetical protein